MTTRPPKTTPTEPWTDAEAEELDALETRIEPRVDDLLVGVAGLFPAPVIGELKELLLSFNVTHPTMARMLKRVGPAPVVEESGTLSSGEPVKLDVAPSKRTSGSS